LFFFSSRRRHTRCLSDWSSDVCSSDLTGVLLSPHSAHAQGFVAGVSATGNEPQAGNGNTASGTESFATGHNATASGTAAIAIGTDSNNGGVSATASGTGSIAIGGDTFTPAQGALATTTGAIAIGDS